VGALFNSVRIRIGSVVRILKSNMELKMKIDAGARAHMYQKLIRPIITEKTSSGGDVVLEVDRRMTKLEIREAFETVFNVKVKAVRTINQRGKVKGSFGKIGRRRDIKKAYISLVKGQSFELIEGL